MIKLESGAELKITVSEFEVSRALYQAICEEAKGVPIAGNTEIDFNFGKDMICILLASKKVEKCIWDCFKRVTYNGVKIDKDTFEPVEARADYLEVCYHVAEENIRPFVKNLFARFSPFIEMIKGNLASKSPTIPT